MGMLRSITAALMEKSLQTISSILLPPELRAQVSNLFCTITFWIIKLSFNIENYTKYLN